MDYGQRHRRELKAAAHIAGTAAVAHDVADIRGAAHLLAGSSLTSESIDVPGGHYTEESMKATVVPNRNMILIALAIARAISARADAVAYAAHSGDHAIYPDCRESFASAMDHAARLADWREIRLLRPFVGMSKADIVRHGAELGVPFGETWSCYQGDEAHCGRCGTCIERREAFHLAGCEDPTVYAADAPAKDILIRNQWRLSPC